ncbi:MAG: GNAT family N-acetyltransferase [Oscillospiraceae bacterium]
MIENALAYDEKFTEILFSSGFLGQKIYADYQTQKKSTTNSFYILGNCGFMLSGTNLTVCGKLTGEDVEQILFFCSFFGVNTIESTQRIASLKVDKELEIMKYVGGGTSTQQGIIKNENIYLFIKFCCENFDGLSFDNVYANFVRKVNGGISDIYYLKKDSRIVSGAITTQYFGDTEYITFVSTANEFRNGGMANKILAHIISQKEGKIILLKCEKQLCEFYQRAGFKPIGKIIVNKFEG